MNKKIILFLAFTYSSFPIWAQSFLNGSFETNTAISDKINLTNTAYNGYMSNSKAFGSIVSSAGYGDMDIITSATYCDVAQNGNWYVALTGGGTDAFSLELSQPLIAGNDYSISFYDRASTGYTPVPFVIGVSLDDTTFGTRIYTAPLAINCTWTKRSFTFTAPNNGKYITVKNDLGTIGNWAHVDDFVMESNSTSIKNMNAESLYRVFPNPASDELNVTETLGSIKSLRVINALGQSVLSLENAHQINLTNLSRGMYILNILTSDGQNLFRPFVKQ